MTTLPTLTTARLTLDSLNEADIPRLAELCGDKRIAATTLSIPHPYTEDDARAWLANQPAMLAAGTGYPFAIRLNTTGELVGGVGLHPNPAHRRAEIGYWVGVSYWGQGYCTEAARAIIRFGFEELQLNAITCGYFVGNTASERVMHKLGITHEGVRRQHYVRFDEYVDLAVGTLLRSAWEAG